MPNKLPSGFSYADAHQIAQFEERGVVNGASKVCLVGDEQTLAVRLHPPKNFDSLITRRPLIRIASEQAGVEGAEGLAWYRNQYNAGYAAANRISSRAWESGSTNHAWDDGYLDRAAQRPKWHLSHCVNHDTCGEG